MTLTLVANVSGGSGVSSNWAYTWAGLPPGCTATTTNTTSCVPNTNGTWSVTVTVHDSVTHQKTTSLPAPVTVNPDPQVVEFTNSAGRNITTGYNFTLSVLVSNGTAPFAYVYKGLFTGCTGTTTPTVSCRAGAPGNYTFNVTATDQFGYSGNASLNLTVTGTPAGYTPPPVTPVHTTTHSGVTTTTYAEVGGIIVVGAIIVAALLVSARRNERQTFRAVPASSPAATTASPSTAPSDAKPVSDDSKPGEKGA